MSQHDVDFGPSRGDPGYRMGGGTNSGGGTNWGGVAVGGALSLLGIGSAVFGGDSDYDPGARAMGRYGELTNPDSDYWKNIKSYFGKLATKGSPTFDTMTSFLQSQGIGSNSSTYLAFQKGKEQTLKNQEFVQESFERARMNTEQTAAQYLDIATRDAPRKESNLGDQLLGLGGGLLSKAIPGLGFFS